MAKGKVCLECKRIIPEGYSGMICESCIEKLRKKYNGSVIE